MTKLFPFITFIIIQSCGINSTRNYDKANFEISNNSVIEIDSLILLNHPNDEINSKVVYRLNSKETKEIQINMTKAFGDGNYTLLYKSNQKWHKKHFGYYTNGCQTEEVIPIQIIEADSVVIFYK